MSDPNDEALAVMRKIARYPEGRIALAMMVRDELDNIDWLLSGAIARCEAAKAKEGGRRP